MINPEIKTAADKIYNLDKQKFNMLIKWIKQAEKYGYSTESIVKTLNDFYPHAMAVKSWYGYLDKMIIAIEPKLTARQHETEHKARKEAERDAARKLFE